MRTLAYGYHEDHTPTQRYEATRKAAMAALPSAGAGNRPALPFAGTPNRNGRIATGIATEQVSTKHYWAGIGVTTAAKEHQQNRTK